MRHIKQYTNQTSIALQINESDLLGRVDSMIPENILDELELNLLVNEGLKKVDEYHRNLMNGTHNVINEFTKMFSKDLVDKLNEAYTELSEKIRSLKLNEQDVADVANATTDQSDWDNVMNNIKNTTDLSGVNTEDKSILSMLKGLLSALTEGGSPIGIVHFILDIVGLVGDAFGVGLIADLLNGVIYLIRGKWILALISFVAAMIPFAGNIVKGMFQTSKVGKEVMHISTEFIESGEKLYKTGETVSTSASKFGAAKITPEAISLVSKAAPESIDALEYLAKNGKIAVPKAGNVLSKFFSGFLGKIVGWIPLIGKPLKTFFNAIGDMFAGFSKSVDSFSNSVPTLIKKAHVEQLDNFFKATANKGSKISSEGGQLVVSWKGGSTALAPGLLKNYDVVLKRYGGSLAKNAEEIFGKNAEAFYKSIGDAISYQEKGYGMVNKLVSTGGKLAVNSISIKKKTALFIGKQIIKFVQSFGDMLNPLTDGEVELIGNSAIQMSMQERIKRDLKNNPDAAYSVPYVDNLKDNDGVKIMVGTLNDYAKRFNMPEIIPVAYYTNGVKDNPPVEVKELMDTLYSDKKEEMKRIEKGGILKGTEIENVYKANENKNGMKHITPFSKFV